MNSTPAKLGIFAIVLAVIFAGAFLVGRTIGPAREAATPTARQTKDSMGPMDEPSGEEGQGQASGSDGDLAYLHTQPHQNAKAGSSGGPAIAFNTTVPTWGSYRLFLNFRHDGVVHTAALSVVIDEHSQRSAHPTARPTR